MLARISVGTSCWKANQGRINMYSESHGCSLASSPENSLLTSFGGKKVVKLSHRSTTCVPTTWLKKWCNQKNRPGPQSRATVLFRPRRGPTTMDPNLNLLCSVHPGVNSPISGWRLVAAVCRRVKHKQPNLTSRLTPPCQRGFNR